MSDTDDTVIGEPPDRTRGFGEPQRSMWSRGNMMLTFGNMAEVPTQQ